jgi:hypothetical protein
MGLTVENTMGEIADNPKGREILDKHLGKFTTHPKFNDFKHMTLKEFQDFIPDIATDEKIKAVDEDLKKM